ncbi:Bipolar DNA helicase [Cystobacter fuscus DSM 2262]|uniref:Bipolar DNA helicase n=1 Tax=Cystobacter fuscus (strain ATCC 25194 / DSM 2262 / NBRC 100088 / M29) TaxID=1242864 RepID=S9PKU2_CYSF2|nr:ATP-binding protein [Cystobacter fuscus]EPX63077.1 Bipolar DNA helicase [Cystobacter fuscus DSM 2262]
MGGPAATPAPSAPRSDPSRPAAPQQPRSPAAPASPRNEVLSPLPGDAQKEFEELAKASPLELDPELEKAVGFTHFDTSSSEDNLITVLTTRADLQKLASQTLVRVKSREDNRSYLGVVVRGPFSEPDAIAANSTMAVGVVVQGKKLTYTFDYHGRADIELLGEEVDDKLEPPVLRPRPKSPVFLLDEKESARVLGLGGSMCLGLVAGYARMEARLDPRDKSILPRHTGIIGTTGGGKSTTVATLIHHAQAAGIATIVFDVEGEYTHVDQPTDHAAMVAALRRRGLKAEGVKDLHIHHLTGRDSRNPRHQNLHRFSLNFSSLSPYAIAEILGMTEAQQERFHKAYDVTKLLLEDFRIFPRNEQEHQQMLDVDEHSTGYPRMTLLHLLDVVEAYIYSLSDEGKEEGRSKSRASSRKRSVSEEESETEEAEDAESAPRGPRLRSEFREQPHRVMRRVREQGSKSEVSWKALMGRLQNLRRLNVFDVGSAPGVDYGAMLTPGRVSVIDLSDTDSPQHNNLVIADILRGLQETQEARYQAAHEQKQSITPVLIIIEEAHEFLSASRITQMPVLFEQVAKIAKRGRKRWLGLVFVTQLPQHLPNEVLGLLNNFIIHKITDSSVISRMQKTAGNIDESLWNRVSRLAPGQALVSFSNFARPLMVAVDPAPVKRLLVD